MVVLVTQPVQPVLCHLGATVRFLFYLEFNEIVRRIKPMRECKLLPHISFFGLPFTETGSSGDKACSVASAGFDAASLGCDTNKESDGFNKRSSGSGSSCSNSANTESASSTLRLKQIPNPASATALAIAVCQVTGTPKRLHPMPQMVSLAAEEHKFEYDGP